MTAVIGVPSGLFDTVGGLPVHILVLHGVVVGVPVMSLVTVAVALKPAWRARVGWAVVVLNALLLGLVWVTVQAGKALFARLDRIGGVTDLVQEHAQNGLRMPWFALGLVVAAVVSALAGRRRGPGLLAVVVAVVAAAAATYAIFVTGESGSAALWRDFVTSSNP